MPVKYPHLYFSDWPFRIVPDEVSCSYMADRSQLVKDVDSLLSGISRQPTSSMHLIWAWFGAGKTHTLKYIENLSKNRFASIVPMYIEFPKSCKNFRDMYKLIISELDMDLVDEAFVNIFGDKKNTNIQKGLIRDYPDLANALRFHFMGNQQEKDISLRWLRGEIKEIRILKAVGIYRPIETAEDMMKIICWIIQLISLGCLYKGNTRRLLLMIDEFQRIKDLRKPSIDEINGCLHSIFNRCPNYLSIIISFSGYPEKKLPDWLSPEIKDRLDKKHLLLPPLSREEAFIFVSDILKHFRVPNSNINDYFPFCKESILAIINKIIEEAKKKKRIDEPKPRTIMHAFNIVLKEAEPLLFDKKELKIIGEDLASNILKEISLLEEA